jgi:Fe-S-cluster containining protein
VLPVLPIASSCSLYYWVKNANCEACCCAAFSVIIVVLDLRFFLTTLLLDIRSLCFSIRVKEQVSRVYQVTDEINLYLFK